MPDVEKSAIVAGRVLRYRVRRHRRARSATARVNRRDGVLITLPWRLPLRVLPGLIAEWEPFLAQEAEKHGVWNGPVVREFSSSSVVFVLGRPRRLQLERLPVGRVRSTARLDPDRLTLAMAPERLLEPRPELEKYLRKLARDDLTVRCGYWAEIVGRSPKKLIFGERRSRWGSCSRSGTLSFCYRLVMAPPPTIDAVVAHEMCHLVHLNHSRRFYALLDRVCPGHEAAMGWLREHHEELIL